MDSKPKHLAKSKASSCEMTSSSRESAATVAAASTPYTDMSHTSKRLSHLGRIHHCPIHSAVSQDSDNRKVQQNLCNSPQKEYYSFTNPGIDMCMDYSSQLSVRSNSSAVDREFFSRLNSVHHPCSNDNGHIQKQVFKNLIVLGVAFMFVFTAFVSLQSLQSTLNAKAGVGVASLCSVNIATVLSCLFAPAVIQRLTTKWTMITAFCLFIIYIATNFYPEGIVIIPASILLGLLTGPLWSAQATYLTTLAIKYAQATQHTYDTTLIKFNGIFGGIFQTSQVWGHIISAAILSIGVSEQTSTTVTLVNYNKRDESKGPGGALMQFSNHTLQCGALDCGIHTFAAESFSYHPIEPFIRHTLLSIHIVCVIIGGILASVMLDKNEVNSDLSHPVSLSSQQLFLATLRMLQDGRMQLLIPLVIFTGMEQGFVFGDFTKVICDTHWG